MSQYKRSLGVGVGWRTELATFIAGLDDLHFVEVVAESIDPSAQIPRPLAALRARDVEVIPHGLRLSLGGAARPEPERLEHLAAVAAAFDSPLVSEHVAFVRAGDAAAGHLMPVPRTRAALEVLTENVAIAQAALPVPLALEHVATLIEWPEAEMDEATFLCELLAATDAQLLLDVSNLHANSRNHGYDPLRFLDRLPLERIAYVHVGGGIERDGIYHDTHVDPVQPEVLTLLEDVCTRATPPGVLLERDDNFPPPGVMAGELEAIRAAIATGARAGELRAVADRRARLAAREAELVRALQGGPVPAGLDERMIGVTRDALGRKRARQVARAFPALARDLGPEYQALFQAFARTTPPGDEGSLADGLAFGTNVGRERRLSDAARVELMVARSTVTASRGRLQPRRGVYVGAIPTRRPLGITVVGRAPGHAPRVVSVTAPRRRSTRP